MVNLLRKEILQVEYRQQQSIVHLLGVPYPSNELAVVVCG